METCHAMYREGPPSMHTYCRVIEELIFPEVPLEKEFVVLRIAPAPVDLMDEFVVLQRTLCNNNAIRESEHAEWPSKYMALLFIAS